MTTFCICLLWVLSFYGWGHSCARLTVQRRPFLCVSLILFASVNITDRELPDTHDTLFPPLWDERINMHWHNTSSKFKSTSQGRALSGLWAPPLSPHPGKTVNKKYCMLRQIQFTPLNIFTSPYEINKYLLFSTVYYFRRTWMHCKKGYCFSRPQPGCH